jgi:hypothetical protein
VALVFADGFDHYESADIIKKWTSYGNWTPTFGGITDGVAPAWARPPGGQGYRQAGGNHFINKVFAGTYATGICGSNVYWESAGGFTGGSVFVFTESGVAQLDVRTDTSGHLVVTRNGTTLATSTNVMSLNTWYHIEFKATIHNTTGAYEVRVNGSSTGWIAPATGANTRTSSNNFFTGIQLGVAGSDIKRYDDFYLLDTSGSVANDFVGPQKITTIYPNAAGNYAQWTGNYAANFANVNESNGDSDSTVNQSSTANQIDTFAFDDVPSGTVTAIQHAIMARQDAGAARTFCPLQRSGTTDYEGTTFTLAGSHIFYLDPKSTNPDTSAAWTVSGLNAAEFGYKLKS